MLALNNAAIKFVSEHAGRGEWKLASAVSRKIFQIVMAVSIAGLSISLFLSPSLAGHLRVSTSTVVLAFLTAFALNMTSYFGGIMYGLGMFREVAIQNIVFYLGRPVAICFAVFGLKIFGLVSGLLVGSLLCLLFSVLILRGRLKGGDSGYPVKRIFPFSAPIYANNIIGLVQGWADVIVLSAAAGLARTGPYFMAVSAVGFLSILWAPLASASFPIFSSIYGRKGEPALEAFSSSSVRALTFIVVPVSLSLAFVSPTFLGVVYGSGYSKMAVPFSMLAYLAIFSAYGAVYSASLQALGKTRPIFAAGALSTLIYLVTLSFLPKILGPVGAAISRCLLISVGFIVLHLSVRRHLRVRLGIGSISKMLVFLILSAPVLVFIQHRLGASYLAALTELVTFASLWILYSKSLKPLSKEDVDLIGGALPPALRFLVKFLA
jgi:O-antigen/teichoic acid export membrane protein